MDPTLAVARNTSTIKHCQLFLNIDALLRANIHTYVGRIYAKRQQENLKYVLLAVYNLVLPYTSIYYSTRTVQYYNIYVFSAYNIFLLLAANKAINREAARSREPACPDTLQVSPHTVKN